MPPRADVQRRFDDLPAKTLAATEEKTKTLRRRYDKFAALLP
jgi:hypothetical protein